MKYLSEKLKRIISGIRKLLHEVAYYPTYKVVSLQQDEHGDYLATVQLTGKDYTFTAKPEEILADDEMTEKFGPKDVRTLTYLGYLGVNSPKYKLLAKRLAENEEFMFVLSKKGSKDVHFKTASEIAKDEEILKSLDQKDAREVGYVEATQESARERKQKEELKRKSKKK